MTKEEKVLWATWMASTDIWEYAVDIVLDFNQMEDFELDRIWKNGLHITDKGLEFVAYPIKSYDVPEVIALTKMRREAPAFRHGEERRNPFLFFSIKYDIKISVGKTVVASALRHPILSQDNQCYKKLQGCSQPAERGG